MSLSFDTLAALRDHLATLDCVETCRIGLEANMTPNDYPMIRIVPSQIANGPALNRRTVSALVYFGQPIHEFDDGLEAQWEALLDMEARLIDAMASPPPGVKGLRYRETILDEDRNEAYKLMALRVEITG